LDWAILLTGGMPLDNESFQGVKDLFGENWGMQNAKSIAGVLKKDFVGGDQCQTFKRGLGYQRAVKGIFVNRRKPRDSSDVVLVKRKRNRAEQL